MPDREKVIKVFESCHKNGMQDCWKCPYDDEIESCSEKLCYDVLKLLKGQEAVKPYIGQSNTDRIIHVRCGACQTAIDREDAYCRACGRKVKWDG